MPKVALRAVLPVLSVLLLSAAPGHAVPEHGTAVRRCSGRSVPRCVRARASADSVRRLDVAIVLATASFNKVLTPAEVERVHEEVAEFHAFYQRHGAGKVDFRFSLVQIDRPIARREVAEVSPNRYYLSRENLEAELVARGFRGRFDEVVALHAWSNANPERALQAYGGGAVGPDGHFLGDAGFNSIPVMGRDPETIGQVLVHEVLHNLDDMFSRSGMADDFLNSDEMSRNMAQLLRDRPGAFLPRYSDAEMLAFADRERQGREGYPWALQLVYYGWMLERTPKSAWDRLRYGRMGPAGAPAVRPLYADIFTSVANDSTYVPVLGPEAAVLTADGRRLTARTYTQADFDGSPIYSGGFYAAWVPLAGPGDSVTVMVRGRVAGRSVTTSSRVIRQRVASVVADPQIVRYVDRPVGGDLPASVLQDRLGGGGPPVPGAQIAMTGAADLLALGTHDVALSAEAAGWYVHPARTRVVARRSWRVTDDGPLTVSLGSPLTLNAFVREDRGLDDARVEATIEGRAVPLTRTGDGRFSVTVPGDLAPGLHWARVTATATGGETVTDSLRVYVRPAGWIRPPESFGREPGGVVPVWVQVTSRMGEVVRGAHLPLVAIIGDRVVGLVEDDTTGRYFGTLPAAVQTDTARQASDARPRVVIASLVGDLQRRVVEVTDATAVPRPRGGTPMLPPYATAVRAVRPPAIDGDLSDWPNTVARPLTIGQGSFVLTDTAMYHGASDLTARLRFAWDDSTLYVGGEIADDSVTGGEAWDTDRVNLVFDMQDNTTPLTYASANPPLNEWQDDDYWVFWRFGGTVVRRFGKTNADPVPGARIATRRTPGGWSFELSLPRSTLPGYLPFVGQVAGLQAFVTDGDGEATATELMWSARWPYSADGIEWRLAELARILFVDGPHP